MYITVLNFETVFDASASLTAFEYTIFVKQLSSTQSYCSYDCNYPNGYCEDSMCKCSSYWIGDSCSIVAEVIYSNTTMNYMLGGNYETKYYKIWNTDLKTVQHMYVGFKYSNTQTTQTPVFLYKDYILGSGTLPSYHTYDFNNDMTNYWQHTLEIEPNWVTTEANYYFMFAVKGRSLNITFDINLEFFFVPNNTVVSTPTPVTNTTTVTSSTTTSAGGTTTTTNQNSNTTYASPGNTTGTTTTTNTTTTTTGTIQTTTVVTPTNTTIFEWIADSIFTIGDGGSTGNTTVQSSVETTGVGSDNNTYTDGTETIPEEENSSSTMIIIIACSVTFGFLLIAISIITCLCINKRNQNQRLLRNQRNRMYTQPTGQSTAQREISRRQTTLNQPKSKKKALFEKHFRKMKYTGDGNKFGHNMCLVCLADFEIEELIRMIGPCKHIFHGECLNSWLDKNKNCPQCKCDLNWEKLELNSSYGFDKEDLQLKRSRIVSKKSGNHLNMPKHDNINDKIDDDISQIGINIQKNCENYYPDPPMPSYGFRGLSGHQSSNDIMIDENKGEERSNGIQNRPGLNQGLHLTEFLGVGNPDGL